MVFAFSSKYLTAKQELKSCSSNRNNQSIPSSAYLCNLKKHHRPFSVPLSNQVVHEATAFIDPENEEKMNEAISEIIEGKTVLIIAHRLNTIKEADKICVLRQGQIIAEGTHDSLLEECEEYKVLWKNSEDSAAWEVKA